MEMVGIPSPRVNRIRAELKAQMDAENEFRVALAKKGGCSNIEIQEQLPVLTKERTAVWFSVDDPNRAFSEHEKRLVILRPEVYVMPCFKGDMP